MLPGCLKVWIGFVHDCSLVLADLCINLFYCLGEKRKKLEEEKGIIIRFAIGHRLLSYTLCMPLNVRLELGGVE